jgi:prephenate dehydratase
MAPDRGDTRYGAIGTLGDPHRLTSSVDAVVRWGRAQQIVCYDTIEAAVADVRQNRLDGVVVPCAYGPLNGLILDPDLVAAESFVLTVRPVVLAGVEARELAEASVVYHHQATTPLLHEVGVPYRQAATVTSNAEAAKRASCDTQSLAITNDRCARHYGLHVHRTLRVDVRMPFVCFTRA